MVKDGTLLSVVQGLGIRLTRSEKQEHERKLCFLGFAEIYNLCDNFQFGEWLGCEFCCWDIIVF